MRLHFIFISLIILSCGCIDHTESNNYSMGYDLGYNDHNITNYQICSDYYYHSWNGSYNKSIFEFAYGYKKGYEGYMDDEFVSRVNKIRSE